MAGELVVEYESLTSAVEELVAKLGSVSPIAVSLGKCFACSRDFDIETALMFGRSGDKMFR
jgi:hypothetical protein